MLFCSCTAMVTGARPLSQPSMSWETGSLDTGTSPAASPMLFSGLFLAASFHRKAYRTTEADTMINLRSPTKSSARGSPLPTRLSQLQANKDAGREFPT
eukprot:16376548-Heterocapsa_arctica.AAC.1